MTSGHVGGTRGSGIVSRAYDVLEMSVVRVMRSWGSVRNVYVLGSGREASGLGFTNPMGTGGSVGHVSVFGLRRCGLSL